MKVRLMLYGALRDMVPDDLVDLDVPPQCDIGTLRRLLMTHLETCTGGKRVGLVQRSAFATTEEVLHDTSRVPANAELAVLPPVSGG